MLARHTAWILALACATGSAHAQVLLNENFATDSGAWNAGTGIWTSDATGSFWVSQEGTTTYGTAFTAYTGTAPTTPPSIGSPVPVTVTAAPGPNIFVSNPPSGSYAVAAYQNGSNVFYGKINSPTFAVTPGDYYAVTYSTISDAGYSAGLNDFAVGYTAANQSPLYGVWWPYNHPDYARPAELTADATGIVPSTSFVTQTYYSRAPVNAVTGYARFQAASSDVQVQNVSIAHVTDLTGVANWANGVFSSMQTTMNMPAINYPIPAGRFSLLPATFSKLESGQPLKIVMVGDSLIQDNADAPIDALLDQYYHNGTRVAVIPAVGSGTSLANWNDPNNPDGLDLTDAVIDQNPDLVILGGISNGAATNATITSLIDKIRSQVQASFKGHTPEFLLMSGPTYDPTEGVELSSGMGAINTNGLPNAAWQEFIPNTDTTSYRGRLQNVVAPAENIDYLDMCGVWGKYLQDAEANGANPVSLYRDGILHTNTYGQEVLGQALAAYLEAPAVSKWTWAGNAGGNWSSPANWGNIGVPNASDIQVVFSGAITAPTAIGLDFSPTAGTLTFDNAANAFTLNGSGVLTLQTTAGNAAIEVLSGTHSIAANLVLASNTDVLVNSSSDLLTLSGALGGSGGLSLKGSGTLILSGSDNSFSGGTFVNEGTLIVNNSGALPAESSLTVGVGGVSLFDPAAAGSDSLVLSIAGAAPVPEPGTLVLVAAAVVMGLGVWERKRERVHP
jgi:autotransporter-associated beta strand protein